ncbi:Cobyrinic acid a,c-diamide synthase [Thiomonas sp. X19]|uniref:ParA family protein n=1 Tax=Thiomonas sp. X19 TaxID=1050370 RepID=UPI000B6B292C|nr:AAA family ATPase [Thiomonas sp. X19]SCC94417.1 Cobyrinic acid a,c-diamide synthase [Thiomonas sp. X19]
MSTPVLTFFNNKGGVGKTSLVFHLAWMFSEMGKRVVTIDLDPQANLTSAFLAEEALEQLWDTDVPAPGGATIYRCIQPLTKVGDIQAPVAQKINPNLFLIPGDLALAGYEDELSRAWSDAMGSNNLYRPFRLLTAFWQVAQMAATKHKADIILADVGPNLGAINRSALIGSDHVVIPLAADLFSLQGLRNLGPTLTAWRADWRKRVDNWPTPDFDLPKGAMHPEGYILMQHMERLSRPVKAYKKWVDRIPGTYQEDVLRQPSLKRAKANDGNCLARLKHYRSLVPMAQEVRKPIFHLTAADGAIGSHSLAVRDAWGDFKALAVAILHRIDLPEDDEL